MVICIAFERAGAAILVHRRVREEFVYQLGAGSHLVTAGSRPTKRGLTWQMAAVLTADSPPLMLRLNQ